MPMHTLHITHTHKDQDQATIISCLGQTSLNPPAHQTMSLACTVPLSLTPQTLPPLSLCHLCDRMVACQALSGSLLLGVFVENSSGRKTLNKASCAHPLSISSPLYSLPVSAHFASSTYSSHLLYSSMSSGFGQRLGMEQERKQRGLFSGSRVPPSFCLIL